MRPVGGGNGAGRSVIAGAAMAGAAMAGSGAGRTCGIDAASAGWFSNSDSAVIATADSGLKNR